MYLENKISCNKKIKVKVNKNLEESSLKFIFQIHNTPKKYFSKPKFGNISFSHESVTGSESTLTL
jgi:hypothetical protein